MGRTLFIPEVAEARQILRYVQLVRDLDATVLGALDLAEVPQRDRLYLHRLRLLSREDHSLLQRQRVVWLKVEHEIPLLEAEARELLEVLGCRGFYLGSLQLDAMVLGMLDLSNAVIGGNYSCVHATILGDCDESNLLVQGELRSEPRTIIGQHRAGGHRSSSLRARDRLVGLDNPLSAGSSIPAATSDPLPHLPRRGYSSRPPQTSRRPRRRGQTATSELPRVAGEGASGRSLFTFLGRSRAPDTEEIDVKW